MYQFNSVGYMTDTELHYMLYAMAHTIIEMILSLSLSFFFWPHFTACGVLVPQPGIKPVPPAM